MLRRIWRAFWTAMREPVQVYGPQRKTMTLSVDVDATAANAKLDALIAKAEKLRALREEDVA